MATRRQTRKRMGETDVRPRVKPAWAKFWSFKVDQYKPECYAIGIADPTAVEHLFSVGAVNGGRVFAFRSTGQRDKFLHENPECQPCLEPLT